jgi:hypothetical protein
VDVSFYNATTFYNFTYSVQIKPDWANNYGVVFNYVDSKNYYKLELDANPLNIALIEVKNGGEKVLASSTYTGGGQGVYSILKVTNDGKSTAVDVNGKNVFNGIATTAFRYGKIGLYAWYQPVWYDNIEVKAESKGFPVGIQSQAENPNGYSCYPNPLGNGDLTIQLSNLEKNVHLEIYNLEGQKIWVDQKHETNLCSVPSSVFPGKGIYVIRLNTEKDSQQFKILYLGD